MDSSNYQNPYSGESLFGFLVQLAMRAWAFITGNLPVDKIASDEVQILVLLGVSSSAALVGTFLILRKMTMLANSISHTILIGIVIAFLWTTHSGIGNHTHSYEGINITALLIASLIMGMLTAFFTELLTKRARLQEDASTGLVFTSLFAIGIIALTLLTRNAHIGTEAVMGNVDALQLTDCKLVFTVLGINILLFTLFFKEFHITTFDPNLSRALGIIPAFFNYLLMAQVSATAIGAFRAVGVLMVLAFITGPAITARLITNSLKNMLIVAVGMGAVASILGVALSRHILTVYGASLSTAGITVCVLFLLYFFTALYAKVYKTRC